MNKKKIRTALITAGITILLFTPFVTMIALLFIEADKIKKVLEIGPETM